jgi:hypothetical protein
MKKQFLAILAAGLMLGGTSRIHAMDRELPPLFHTQDEQDLLLKDYELIPLSQDLTKTDKKRSIDQVDHDDDDSYDDDNSGDCDNENDNDNNNNNNATRRLKCGRQGCDAVFSHKSTLCYHRNTKHPDTAKLFTCSFCTMVPGVKLRTEFPQPIYIKHLRTHTEPHLCEHCSKRFAHKYLLSNHLETAHGITNNANSAKTNVLPCLTCGLQCITDLPSHKSQCKKTLELALRSMGIQPSDENMIKVGFIDSRYEKINEFKCASCNQIFETSTRLSIHTSMKHNPQKINAKIPAVDVQATDNEKSAVDRIAKVTSPKCPICSIRCKTTTGCAIHIARVHRLKFNPISNTYEPICDTNKNSTPILHEEVDATARRVKSQKLWLNPASNAYEYVYDANENNAPALYEKVEIIDGDTIHHKYKCLHPTGNRICGVLTRPYPSSFVMHHATHRDEKPLECSIVTLHSSAISE